jgi:hypothetical protein
MQVARNFVCSIRVAVLSSFDSQASKTLYGQSALKALERPALLSLDHCLGAQAYHYCPVVGCRTNFDYYSLNCLLQAVSAVMMVTELLPLDFLSVADLTVYNFYLSMYLGC